MAGSSYGHMMPPMLEIGDVVRFHDAGQLSVHLDGELRSHALTVIDISGIRLYEDRSFELRVNGAAQTVKIVGRAVHRQADVVGLQLDVTAALLDRLEALVDEAGGRPEPVAAPEPEPEPAPAPEARPAAIPDRPVSDDSWDVAPWESDDLLAPPDPEPPPAPPAPAAPMRQATPAPRAPANESAEMGGLLLDPSPSPHPARGARPTPAPRAAPTPLPRGATPPPTSPARAQRVPLQESLPPQVGVAERLPVSQGVLRPIREPFDIVRAVGLPSLFALLLELQRACRAGRLTVLLPRGPRGFSLDRRGCICDFEGDLADALRDDDLLDRHTADALGRIPGAMTQAEALLSGGAPGVTPPPLAAVRSTLRRVLVDTLTEIASLSDVRYFFDPNERVRSVRELRLPFLDYAQEWLERSVRRLHSDDFERQYAQKKDHFPILVQNPKWNPGLLPLERAETRFVEDSLPKGKSLRDLLTFSPMSRTLTYRLICELQALDMLRFQAEPPDFAEELDAEGAVVRRLKMARESHFAALGVHVTTHHSEYDAALEKVKSRYAAGGTLARHSDRAARGCRQIIELAGEARDYLSDKRRRVTYRHTLHTHTELTGMAVLLAGKVQLSYFRGDETAAAQFLEVARELDPHVKP